MSYKVGEVFDEKELRRHLAILEVDSEYDCITEDPMTEEYGAPVGELMEGSIIPRIAKKWNLDVNEIS